MYANFSQKIVKKVNPISCYNLVIKQYNDPINRQSNVYLETAHNDCLYKKWYKVQAGCCFLLVLAYVLPYVNLITLVLNAFLLLINEFGLSTFRTNQKKIDNPLKYMVYEPTFCNRSSSCYLYFEIKPSDLKAFKLDNHTEQQVLKRNEMLDEGSVRFMAYNSEFISGYYSMIEYRYRAILHMMINAVIVMIMQYFIYYPFFCLALMNPLDSISKCLKPTHLISEII